MKLHAPVVCGALFSLQLAVAPLPAQSPNATHLAWLRTNVVRIDAGDQTGFGFIVGLRSRELLIATAWHTLGTYPEKEFSACFAFTPVWCTSAHVAYVADAIGTQQALDLAIVAASYPEGLPWRPDVMADRPKVNEAVWFIGRAGQWYIPDSPGHVVGFDSAAQQLSYRALEVTEGVSGAPIVSVNGVVAMHVASVGATGEAYGVDMQAIRQRVINDMRGRWILMSPATCSREQPLRQMLAGRTIAVGFDAEQPDLGLAAVARLNCLGAYTLPRPVWPGEPWPGTRVEYASGDLRAARALQTALSQLARLDTRLGKPGAGLEIWVR